MGEKKELRREVYAKRKSAGLCVRCGQLAVTGGVSCAECAAKQAAYTQQRREKRKTQGACIACGEPAVERGLCRRHLEMRNEAVAKITTKRQARRDNGLCEQCGNPALDRVGQVYKVCESCYLKKVAKTNLGDLQRWSSLRKLLESQGGVCPYTGEKLVLGINTTLDHKMPLSRGGDNSFSNLQWVYFDVYGGFDVNRMKGAMTDEEYRAAIKQQCDHLFRF